MIYYEVAFLNVFIFFSNTVADSGYYFLFRISVITLTTKFYPIYSIFYSLIDFFVFY